MDYNRLRQEVDIRLSRSVTDSEWEYFVDEGSVGDAITAEERDRS